MLAALQQRVGAPGSSVYDDATIQAVARAQRALGDAHVDGLAGPKTLSALGLCGTPMFRAAMASKGLPSAVPPWPWTEISVALCVDFHDSVSGAREFHSRARDYARKYGAVSKEGNKLVLGRSTLFNGLGGMVAAIHEIHAALRELARGDATQKGTAQLQHLAIFTHGLEKGICTNPARTSYWDGLHKDMARKNPPLWKSNIDWFVERVKHCLSPSVSVQLYACSAGQEVDHAERAMPEEGERRGADSFAAWLARSLHASGLTEASVYAHTVAGHTTENYCARVFGAAARTGQAGAVPTGGTHLFELLYPSDFIDGVFVQATALGEGELTADDEDRREQVRESLWEHYRDCIQRELMRRNGKDKSPRVFAPATNTYLGMEAFQDLEATRHKLWSDYAARHLERVLAQSRIS